MDLKELDEFIGKVRTVAEMVSTVRDNIRDRPTAFRTNERQTRSGLIDPILKVLGWDVSQVELVGSEYRTNSSGTADYALLDQTGPIALIEAKSLGRTLDVRIVEQLSNYTGNEPTVRFALFTNGDHWRMRETGKSGAVIDIHLSKQRPLESALELMRLSRSVMQPADNLPDHDVQPQQPTENGNWDWKRIDDKSIIASDQKPLKIRFSDGTEIDVVNWREVYISVANWLIRTGRITAANVPVRLPASVTRCAVNALPIHPNGRPFWTSRKLENGLFLELDTGSVTADLSYAVKLVSAVGMAPDAFEVLVP